MYNDDAAQLFLSTDATESNLQLLIDSPIAQPAFDTSVMGASPALIAGQKYLLQALLRQYTNTSFLGVAARLQGDVTPPALLPVLGGDQISTLAPASEGTITFIQQPADANSSSGSRARFSVVASSSGSRLYYQWQVNGVPIPNADRAGYVTPVLSTNDNGNIYQVQVSSGGSTLLSGPAYLGVSPGNTPRAQPYIGVNFLGADPGSVGAGPRDCF